MAEAHGSMTDKMILRVKAGLSWGFMIHVPFQTASPQPIPYPPPTTLVGALAAAYARWKDYPETLLFNGRPYSFAVRLLLDKMVRLVLFSSLYHLTLPGLSQISGR